MQSSTSTIRLQSTTKSQKCSIFINTIDSLLHNICPREREIALRTPDAIRTLREPNDEAVLQLFPGIYNVFSQFTPTFAPIADPLNKKL